VKLGWQHSQSSSSMVMLPFQLFSPAWAISTRGGRGVIVRLSQTIAFGMAVCRFLVSEFDVTFTNDLLVNYLNIGCPEYRIGVVDAARMEVSS